MQHASQIHVDLAAVDHNMKVLRQAIGREVLLCPILKADGYGLGAAAMTEPLIDAGADMLAVYTPEQAMELAGPLGPAKPVLILMPLHDVHRLHELHRWFASGRLHLTVHDLEHLQELETLAASLDLQLPLHLELDTGMSRGGCCLDDVSALLAAVRSSPHVRLAGLFTHFSSAEHDDDRTIRQLQRLESFCASDHPLIPRDCIIHAANTAAALRDARYHRSMVRIGRGWIGYGPDASKGDNCSGEFLPHAAQLWPAVSWVSRIVHVKTIQPGQTVGYGATWTARRVSRIGLVPVGYADGYPVGLGATDHKPQGAKVGVMLRAPGSGPAIAPGIEMAGGEHSPPIQAFAPVIGVVNMDQITIDLTGLPRETGWPEDCVGVGSTVELITAHPAAPNHVPRLARLANTIPYDLLCRLGPRLPRVYSPTAGAIGAKPPSMIGVG